MYFVQARINTKKFWHALFQCLRAGPSALRNLRRGHYADVDALERGMGYSLMDGGFGLA